MDIFNQIGINTTAIIQFGFFAVALLVLSKVVFTPYAHALEERQKRTKGGEDLALEFQKKSIDLQAEYETKARALNGEIKTIIDQSRTEANKQFEGSVAQARETATKLIADNRNQIAKSIDAAAADLRNQTSNVAMVITNKLLGK